MSIQDVITLSISIISLVISIIVASSNLWRKRFSLTLYQDYDGDQSGLLKTYDGLYNLSSNRSGKPKMDHVALAMVTISNNSSEPVTIISFDIGENISAPFASHSHTEPYYRITTSEHSVSYFGFKDQPLTYIKPLFTLKPYEALQGYLSFWVHDTSIFELGKPIPVKILTSRKTAIAQIKFGSVYESNREFIDDERSDLYF